MPSSTASPDLLAEWGAQEGVPSAMAAARDAIDLLLRDRGLRRTGAEVTAESLLRGAHASAVLSGSASSWEEVRDGRGDEVAVAAVRLSTHTLSVVPALRRAPLQAFARLHAVAVGAQESAGRPSGPEGARVLGSLGRLLTTPTTAPALVVAAIAHAEIAAAEPFASYDGLVARAVERALLVERGVDPPSVVVPEAGHLAVRAAYESNLRAYRDGGAAGRRAWLLYAAEAYGKGVEASPLTG